MIGCFDGAWCLKFFLKFDLFHLPRCWRGFFFFTPLSEPFPYYPYLLFLVLNILIYIQTDKCNKTPQACHSLVEGNDNRHFYSIVVWFDETRNKLNSALSWRRRKIRRASIPDEGDKLSKEKWFQSKESFLPPPSPRTSISSNLFRQIPLLPQQHLTCLSLIARATWQCPRRTAQTDTHRRFRRAAETRNVVSSRRASPVIWWVCSKPHEATLAFSVRWLSFCLPVWNHRKFSLRRRLSERLPRWLKRDSQTQCRC